MSNALVRRLLELIPGVCVIALVLGAIEFASRAGWVNEVILPPPSGVAKALWQLIESGSVLRPLVVTLSILFLAYAIACIAAIGVGALMGYYQAVYGLLEPLVEIFRIIPKPVLVPPLMLFLGLGAPMKLFVVALAAFFPVLINTVQAVRAVDPVLIDTARTFGHTTPAIFAKVILPASVPMILAGMRVSLGIALILVILSEMLAGTGGLGQLILDMQHAFKVRETFAWLVVLAVVGFVLAMLFDWAERRVAFWNAPRQS